jgi:hypothetical protein
MDSKGIVDAADKIAGIFSPFKTIYFGFVAVLLMERIQIEDCGGLLEFAYQLYYTTNKYNL